MIDSSQNQQKASENNTSNHKADAPNIMSPLNIVQHNGIETYIVNTEIMGTHAVHWDALSTNPEQDVPKWLDSMIDAAVIPAGLHNSQDNLPQDILLIANAEDVHVCQLYQLDANQKPAMLLSAFPSVNSPYTVAATIVRIIENTDTTEAVLRLETQDGTTIYAFDSLYAVNKDLYQANTLYEAELSGICHNITHFNEDEIITITDEEAIKHHRALNDILAKNNGEAPDDLQEQLANWQPNDEVDTMPVTLNLGKMCAYLYGENTAQEDEAWCQGEIIGLQNVTILEKSLKLLDIVVLREEDTLPVVVRAVLDNEQHQKNLQVGDYVRSKHVASGQNMCY